MIALAHHAEVEVRDERDRAPSLGGTVVVDGRAIAPDTPGLGIDWQLDLIDDRRVA